jgi:LemA protein
MTTITLIVLVVTTIVVILWGVSLYNKMIRLKNIVVESEAQIDVQLQRRCDLIPNLVETVKGYAAHESETLEAVMRARSGALAANTIGEKSQADGLLTGALRGLLAVSEAYPELRADGNFLKLQEELVTTENSVAYARQRYNDTVRNLNTAVESIPTKFVAGIAKAEIAEFFESDEAAKVAPKVQF